MISFSLIRRHPLFSHFCKQKRIVNSLLVNSQNKTKKKSFNIAKNTFNKITEVIQKKMHYYLNPVYLFSSWNLLLNCTLAHIHGEKSAPQGQLEQRMKPRDMNPNPSGVLSAA